jgi:hypothetical protein
MGEKGSQMRKHALRRALCSLLVAVLAMWASPAIAVASAAGDRIWVQYLAKSDPRSPVRIAAWQALLSSAPDAAIAQFVESGYDYAVKLSAERKARNMDFAKRVLAAFTAEFAPEVHKAAAYAVNSRDDADRERFANGGFEAAKLRDAAAREALGEQAQALVEADRAFVRSLAANDPGAQVRVSAAYATRIGAGDGDLVDFFAAGWAFGARLDLETQRQLGADNDMRWRATLNRLVEEAAAAEKAAREASDEMAEQAKAAAVRAWQTVGEQTAPGRSYWSDAQRHAEQQAANWAAVYAAAVAAAGPNWAAIVTPAQSSQSSWDAERSAAAQQAQYWNDLLQQARDGEQRVRDER